MAFVDDTFTDAENTLVQNHTGEIGATWTKHSGSGTDAKVTNANRVIASASDQRAIYYASGVPANAEYDVEGSIRAVTNDGIDEDISVAGRMSTTATTFYFAENNPLGTDAWYLYKVVSGTFTSLGSYAQTLTAGNSYTVKLEIRDAAKKVYVDTVERISSTDNAITAAGRAGFYLWRDLVASNTTGFHLDSITASDVGGAGPTYVQTTLRTLTGVGA